MSASSKIEILEHLESRLRRNLKRLKGFPWFATTTAYRLYDHDIPEIPFIIESYGKHFVVWEKNDPKLDTPEKMAPLRAGVQGILKLLSPRGEIVIKQRIRHNRLREQKYQKQNQENLKKMTLTVKEEGRLYLVDLSNYLDTGLFIDHRPLRRHIQRLKGVDQRFLNLFCYTGTVSVAAAQAGFRTTNVDLSNTYLDWAQQNFGINQLEAQDHDFFKSNVLDWLDSTPQRDFSLAFVDPPTTSVSKGMSSDFRVQRDHYELLRKVHRLMARGGEIIFSTNMRNFRLDSAVENLGEIKTWPVKASIPPDFRDPKTHHLFSIRLIK